MKLSRRNFVRSSALVGAVCLGPGAAFAELSQAVAGEPPIRLGLASYTFRNFSRAQMIGFLKTLNITGINAKDTKYHLPMMLDEEAKALADYARSEERRVGK